MNIRITQNRANQGKEVNGTNGTTAGKREGDREEEKRDVTEGRKRERENERKQRER